MTEVYGQKLGRVSTCGENGDAGGARLSRLLDEQMKLSGFSCIDTDPAFDGRLSLLDSDRPPQGTPYATFFCSARQRKANRKLGDMKMYRQLTIYLKHDQAPINAGWLIRRARST